MVQTAPKYFVVGLTHIDLAWKKERLEHEEIFESAILRLLDVLDRYPTFTYILEQAAHYHSLAQRRPDLIARLREYLQEGRLEFVGGLASTLETNGPSGESFVRNQLLGLRSVRELFGVTVKTGYLIDTFGINAQVPQILRQFGLQNLLANRFGGTLEKDTFIARGLDGSRILVAGRDANSPYVAWDRVFFSFVQENKHTKALFEKADTMAADGPCLVMPYTEYDGIASTYIAKLLDERRATDPGNSWTFSTLSDFFDALSTYDGEWPEYSSDLNAEFTGTFGLRPEIRRLHRRVEVLLLAAEQWATLCKATGWKDGLTSAWWNMAFAQSHDVYSGSHPTAVYEDTVAQLRQAERAALNLLETSARHLATGGGANELGLVAMNSLPWQRDAVVAVDLPNDFNTSTLTSVSDQGKELPFEIDGQVLKFRASFPGVSARKFFLRQGAPGLSTSPELVGDVPGATRETLREINIVEQDITVTASVAEGLQIRIGDANGGIAKVIGIELVLQEDRGSFQIEDLKGADVSSRGGLSSVSGSKPSSLLKQMSIRGKFPSLWTRDSNPLDWQMDCTLVPGKRHLELVVKMHWRGEASRVRLKIVTGYESSAGIFEVPFGAVRRSPYHSRRTARGEWPVHRWVAVEEDGQGVALINTGSIGAEVVGGTIWTTLLRAPTSEYAGMVADETSSQHGDHSFHFAILPYEGSWSRGDAIQLGQELNSPVHCYAMPTDERVPSGALLTVSPSTIVLSSVKSPEDETPNEMIVRVYEATGRATTAELYVKDARSAWLSDLTEYKRDVLEVVSERIAFNLLPFEIKTIRIGRA